MSVYAGPTVVSNGLVLHYDMGNTQKSFVGASANNLIVTVPYTLGIYAYVTGPVSTSSVLDATNNFRTVNRYTITTAINNARAAFTPTVAVGSTYTFSCIIKYNGVNVAVPSFWVDASKGYPEATGANTLSGEVRQYTLIANGWYALRYTFTVTASPTLASLFVYGVTTGSDSTYIGQTFDVYNPQFEINSIATPYISGIRSNTQAILDLTNTNVITANALTYSSDNTFSFNGSNNYISIPYTATINAATTFTVDMWFKSSSIATEQMLFSTSSSTGPTGWHIEIYSSKVILQVYPGGMWTSSTQTLSSNTIYNLTVTYSSGSIAYYLNGVAMGTGSYTFTPSTANPYIGNWSYNSGVNQLLFNGTIYSTKFYNRVLPASEITANFNALRGRYAL